MSYLQYILLTVPLPHLMQLLDVCALEPTAHCVYVAIENALWLLDNSKTVVGITMGIADTLTR